MLAAIPDDEGALRERRCIATGAILPEEKLVRFVVSPDGDIVPDLDAKLPGRGIWLSTDRAAMAKAVAKNDFAKAAKAKVRVTPDLPDHVERLLVARLQADLGMAKRAGQLVSGFDKLLESLDKKVPPRLIIDARDGAEDGRRKIASKVRSRSLGVDTIAILTRDELSLALGRENVVHAAVLPGALADRLLLNAKRLAGLRDKPADTTGQNHGLGQNESKL
jgi:predicted RNA-binding protein YlxR (DUF448 family)